MICMQRSAHSCEICVELLAGISVLEYAVCTRHNSPLSKKMANRLFFDGFLGPRWVQLERSLHPVQTFRTDGVGLGLKPGECHSKRLSGWERLTTCSTCASVSIAILVVSIYLCLYSDRYVRMSLCPERVTAVIWSGVSVPALELCITAATRWVVAFVWLSRHGCQHSLFPLHDQRGIWARMHRLEWFVAPLPSYLCTSTLRVIDNKS